MQKIYDVHVHVGNSSALYVAGSVDTVVTKMDQNDVTHAAISPIPGFEDPEGIKTAKMMNQQIADVQRQYPERFPVGLGVAEPQHGKYAMEEVEHALGELKLQGIMFHNDFNGVEVEAPVMFDIMSKINEFPGAVVMLHTAYYSDLEPPFMIGRIARKFPDINIVVGHPLMTLNQTHCVIDLANDYHNLYLDTCYTYHHSQIIEQVVENVGSDRMIFGSDNPYYGTLCLDKVLVETAQITKKDRENILCNTFEKVFHLKEA